MMASGAVNRSKEIVREVGRADKLRSNDHHDRGAAVQGVVADAGAKSMLGL